MPAAELDTCTWLRIRASDGFYLGPMKEDGTVIMVSTENEAGSYRLNTDIASCMPLERTARYYLTDRASGRRVGAPSSPTRACSLFGEVETPALLQLGGSGDTYRLVFHERIVPWYAANCKNLLGVTASAADSLDFRLERADDTNPPTSTPKNNLWWIILVSVLGGLLLIGVLVSIGIYISHHKQLSGSKGAQKTQGSQPWDWGGFGSAGVEGLL